METQLENKETELKETQVESAKIQEKYEHQISELKDQVKEFTNTLILRNQAFDNLKQDLEISKTELETNKLVYTNKMAEHEKKMADIENKMVTADSEVKKLRLVIRSDSKLFESNIIFFVFKV